MPKSEQHIFFKKISHTYLIRLLHVHVVQYGRLMQKILFTIEHTIFVVLCFPGYITWICCIQKVFGYLVFYSLLFCHQNSRLFVMSFSKRSNGQFVAEQAEVHKRPPCRLRLALSMQSSEISSKT